MSINVIDIKEIPSVVGSYSADHSVIVDGHSIPRMRCIDHGLVIEFILDRRFSFTFPKECAYLAAHFAAQAMAIGEGYPHLGAETKDRPFAPQLKELGDF